MSMIETAAMQVLSRFLDVASARHALVTTNLANVDTPGYRTRDLNFRAELERALDPAAQGTATLTPAARHVEGLLERPDGNNVSLERETLLLAQNQVQFNLGVQLLRAEFRRLQMAINEGR